MDIFHFVSDVSCSALDVSILLINAQVFHVHQHSRILARFSLGGALGPSNKHVEGSADVWKPAGASYLRWLQNVDFQLNGN